MKRSELPYFSRTTDEKGREYYLLGGTAQAIAGKDTEIVRKQNRRTGDEDVPHLVISLPIADFVHVEWATLQEIAETERREREKCQA